MWIQGDNVIVINAEKVALTGRKLLVRFTTIHTNHPGGLKQHTAGDFRAKEPEKLIETSVKECFLILH